MTDPLHVVTEWGDVVKVASVQTTGFRLEKVSRHSAILEIDFNGEESAFFYFLATSDGRRILERVGK